MSEVDQKTTQLLLNNVCEKLNMLVGICEQLQKKIESIETKITSVVPCSKRKQDFDDAERVLCNKCQVWL